MSKREIPMLGRAASITPSTINEENRTIELTFSTGAKVRRVDFWTGNAYDEELVIDKKSIRMDRLNNGASLLNSHNSFDLRDVVGVVEKAWIEDGQGRATVRFSQREDVEPIWRDVQTGIIRNISVGYIVHRFEKVENKGEKVPVWRAVDWEPVEISLVPVPADAKAQVRSALPLHECDFVDVDEQQRSGEVSEPAADTIKLRLIRQQLELQKLR